jgi:tetratricopeptide (TPR) repeat protein
VAGDFEHCDHLLDEALEIAGDDHGAGAGIVIGCPYAWCLMAKAVLQRDRGDLEAAEKLSDRAIRIAGEHGDPETEGWTRGNLAVAMVYRGDLDGALALAQRNYELTERLGDVFSRQWALVNLGYVHLERGDAETALQYVERADQLYLEAMGRGGEAEGWRNAMIAEALLGVGRVSEALERAEHAVAVIRERGLDWGAPRALRALALARSAAGTPGAEELFDESERVATDHGQVIEAERTRAARDRVAAASR